MNLGITINRLRKEGNMTLAELSEKSGVALATLSRMENGKMTGTLESHMKICDALGLALPELYRDISSAKKAADVQTQRSRAGVFVHDKRSSEEMLASKASGKNMMPILIKISKGAKTNIDKARPGSEKFVYVLEGKVEAVIGGEKYDLKKGDTLYFAAGSSHSFKNLSGSESKLICVISPPLS